MPSLNLTKPGCALLLVILLACSLVVSAQEAGAPEVQRIFIPGTDLALDLDLRVFVMPAFEKEADRVPGNDGLVREYIAMPKVGKGGHAEHAFLKIRVEPQRAFGGANALRDDALVRYRKGKGDFQESDFVLSDYKQTPVLRYKIAGTNPSTSMYVGRSMPSRVMEAYLAQEGAWVTLSYMGRKLEPENEKFFYALLDSAKLVDVSRPLSSYDYFTLGEEFYRQKRQSEAIAALEKALELEKKQRTLTQQQWRHLLMNLANSLGATDKVERAKELLEYGAATDPTYPYFHHGLSRLYSYFGDLDRLLAELEKAYQYGPDNSKRFIGMPIPDPLLDPAFQKYRDDPKFRDTVKALKKKYKS